MSRSRVVAAPARLRCAIYTRKSSEEGLEQGFNSLHAQREACEAYVLSQAGEGWSASSATYDDGGFSGGSMERPGLTKLLADIDAGRVDVVVVYKVDRLTRSLTDFAKIVERFDAQGVSFVSVTQAFNTTTSMGRLTLNVLLSFAQFEREVTGERIRDKIAASKAKGMWMGGNIPLGYDTEGRALVVNPGEAEQVRHIFRRYLDLGSVHALRDDLEDRGVRSKQRTSNAGKVLGGVAFSRGALFHLLSNQHYLGLIVHKDQTHPGQHPAIVDAALFEAVQLKLAENAGGERRAKVGLAPRAPTAPFAGRIFDDRGHPMSPVAARKGRGRLYRYYVSAPLQQGRRAEAGTCPRMPAAALEELIRARLASLGLLQAADGADVMRELVERIEVARHKVVVRLSGDGPGRPAHAQMWALAADDLLEADHGQLVLTIAATIVRRGAAKTAVGPRGVCAIDTPRVDFALLRALVRAEAWKAQLLTGGAATLDALIREEGVDRGYAQRLLRIAFLSPDLKRSIVEGRTPANLSLQKLVQGDMPLAWSDQRARWYQSSASGS